MGWTRPVNYFRHGLLVRQLQPDADAQILAGIERGLSFKEIASKLHRNESTIRSRAIRLGVHKPVPTRRVTRAERELILRLAADGLNANRIAPLVGRAAGTVFGVMQRMRVPPLYAGHPRIDPFRPAKRV